jgi:hypothetical protein
MTIFEKSVVSISDVQQQRIEAPHGRKALA